MRFKRQLAVLSSGVGLLLGGVFFVMFNVTEEDVHHFEFLNQKVPEEVSTSQTLTETNRTSTLKTLLLSEGKERRKGVLSSAESTLKLIEDEGERSWIEEMTEPRLVYQEALFKEGGDKYQTVLTLEAEKGVYYYRLQELVADKIKMKRYHLKGYQLPSSLLDETPFMETYLEHAVVSLAREGNLEVGGEP